MALQLPRPIADYFNADRSRNADLVSDCFDENAVVTDEQAQHIGRKAIRAWKLEAARRFSYSVEPQAIERDGDCEVVSALVTGDFAGSPVELRYFFKTQGDRIVELEIRP